MARLEVRLPQPRREEGPRPAEQGGEHRREGARQGAQLRDGLAGKFIWLPQMGDCQIISDDMTEIKLQQLQKP